jgi:hypothetical protein
MKFLFLITALFINIDSISQFRSQEVGHYIFTQPASTLSSTKTVIPGLVSDPARNYRLTSPMMFGFSGYDYRIQNSFFWTGNITTMSYNKGKFGTYFYWDVQGNLSATKGFIDIAGKNKRGLKLTFLWRSIVNR